MRNGQDPNSLAQRQIGDVMGKYLEIDTPISPGTQPRNLGISNNPPDVAINLVPESLPKARLLVIVLRDRIFKFIGCLRQNDDFHEAKRLSTRANTSS